MKMLRLLGSIYVVLSLAALIGCFGAGLVPEDDGDDGNGDTGGTAASNGTVTVSISNAGQAEGETLLAYAYEAGEWITDMPEYVLGAGSATITDGTAEFVLNDSIDAESWEPTGDEWTATGGENYDLYIYTYAPAEGDAPQPPMSSVLDPWPRTVAVDGDTTVAVDLSDFTAYAPTGGTLTVSISGAQEHAGKLFFFGVWETGGTPATDPLARGDAVILSGGSVSAVAEDDETGGNWIGDPEGQYDVYIFIDADDDGIGGGPGEGDLVYKVDPVTYWQYEDKLMPTRYEDYKPLVIPDLSATTSFAAGRSG